MLARPITSPYHPSDGLVDLPPGKIAAIATYLDMRSPPPDQGWRPPGALERLGRDIARYRTLYSQVGAPWLWFSRALMKDDALGSIIGDEDVEALALVDEGRDIALAELDWRKPGECELAFFGLVPEACGKGLGRLLMAEVVRRAFSRPIDRLWLHTCTLDHPAAVGFYMRCGFKPYRRAIEIADDPRLSGHLSLDAGTFFPIV